MTDEFKNPLNRIAQYLLIGITILLIVFLLLAFLRIGLVYWLWSTVETWVTIRLGLDYYGAQLLTMIILSLVVAVLPSIAWYSLIGKRRWQGTAAMIGGQALIFILVYTIGAGVCFDRRTGEPLCWYADIPGKGRVFSRTPGFDPETGEPFRQYTPETPRAMDATPKKMLEMTFASSPVTTMSVVKGAGLFSSGTTTTFRIELRNFQEANQASQSELRLTICNIGSSGMEFTPLYAWYTYAEPNARSTLRWSLKPDNPENPDYYLRPGECKNAAVPSDDSPGASIAAAIGAPPGMIYFSARHDQSFCQIDLSQYAPATPKPVNANLSSVKVSSGNNPRWNHDKAKLYGVYEVTVPRSDDWLKTDIELRPDMEARVNFEDVRAEILGQPLSLHAGQFSASYTAGWDGKSFYQQYLTTGPSNCGQCVHMTAPAKLEVKSPTRGVRFRIELYQNLKY